MHVTFNPDFRSGNHPIGWEATVYVYIRLFVHSTGSTRLRLRTGVRIEPRYWDSVKHCAKRNYPGVVEFNHYLQDLKTRILSRLMDLAPEKASLDTIVSELKKEIGTEVVIRKQLFDCFSEYIETKRVTLSKNASKKHVTARNHLKDYSAQRGWTASFDAVDQAFFEDFQRYLIQEKKHLNNTVLKQIVILKGFLNWALERGYTSNENHRRFKIREQETDVIHLTEPELMAVYHLDLSSNRKLRKVRDAFCFQCFTGQRYGDVANLDWDAIDFENRWWTLTSQKTKDKLRIPLNDYALTILNRYREMRTLPVMSNQKINQYIKEVGRLAGVNSPFSVVQFSGSRRIEYKGPKYEFLTSHVARKTFVTLSLAKGMRQETVMAITGHRDHKTMRKYLKITSDMKMTEMNNIWSVEEEFSVYHFQQ